MSDKSYTKMEKLMFEASLQRGLKDVEDGTKVPYPTLININRGYQMKKGKKLKYHAHRGTQLILEDFFGVPWKDIFEDKHADAMEAKAQPSSDKAMEDTFTIQND